MLISYQWQRCELNQQYPFIIDLKKILPDFLKARTTAKKPHIKFSQLQRHSLAVNYALISVFIKKLMKKMNSTPILDVLFHRVTSNSTLIQMLLSAYINIILALFLIYNSLILFFHKNLSSCSKKSFSSQQKQCNMNYSDTRVLFTFICTSDCQSNTCNQTVVLLQINFRLKFLTEYSIEA